MCVFFVVCFIPFLPRVKRKIFLSSRRFVLSLSCLSKKKKKERKRERGGRKKTQSSLCCSSGGSSFGTTNINIHRRREMCNRNPETGTFLARPNAKTHTPQRKNTHHVFICCRIRAKVRVPRGAGQDRGQQKNRTTLFSSRGVITRRGREEIGRRFGERRLGR